MPVEQGLPWHPASAALSCAVRKTLPQHLLTLDDPEAVPVPVGDPSCDAVGVQLLVSTKLPDCVPEAERLRDCASVCESVTVRRREAVGVSVRVGVPENERVQGSVRVQLTVMERVGGVGVELPEGLSVNLCDGTCVAEWDAVAVAV